MTMSATRFAKAAIKLPKAIPRTSTDILKALASSVKHVPQNPPALLHDDPYLLPTRPGQLDLYSMARLSGKNTAKFLLNKHPEMFYRDDSEPKVRSFLPNEEYNEEMEFSENDIRWCIENNDVINGITAYKKLDNSNISISNETLLDLFELICYTNEDKIKDMLEIQSSFFDRESGKNQTWNSSGLNRKIFEKVKDVDPSRAYSTMISGLTKFNEHPAAKKVFQEFIELYPELGLHCCAYDGLLKGVPVLHSSIETAHASLNDIVKHMEQQLVMPNLQVFNSILTVYRSFFCNETVCTEAIKMVNDMRALNIQPSLYTFVCIIGVICRSKSNLSKYRNLVPEILDYMESNDVSAHIRDERDLESLSLAMKLICSQMHNVGYANKLHKIYLKRPNLFLHRNLQNRYLNDYLRLVVTTENLDRILEFYSTYVPMYLRPSADVYEALIEALDLYQADPETVKKIREDSSRITNNKI